MKNAADLRMFCVKKSHKTASRLSLFDSVILKSTVALGKIKPERDSCSSRQVSKARAVKGEKLKQEAQ